MRQIGEIMEELGFNKDAPEGAQRAFLKHLFKSAQQSLNQGPVEPKNSSCKKQSCLPKKVATKSSSKTHEQLSFDLEDAS